MRKGTIAAALVVATTSIAGDAIAQPGDGQAQPFAAGSPLGVTAQGGAFTPMSDNVRVFGSFNFAESCTYDESRNLIVVMNRGASENQIPNDAYVSLLNPDGTVHTSKWIGATRNGLTLNDPLGSAIRNGILYAADGPTVRTFDLESGRPLNSFDIPEANFLNGIAVTADGTIYVSNTRAPERIYRVTATGESSVFVEGAPLAAPNGVAIDNDGNIVVVNIGNTDVLTFSPAGQLVRTEQAAQPGNDGLVILPDGVKYVSSVQQGGVSRIRPGQPAELIATGIPSAASMCYDSRQRQLIIPMNPHNALAFIQLD